MDRQVFFNAIRKSFPNGRLSKSQVDGMERLLNAWDQFGDGDRHHLAYALATVRHETGNRMQPVSEVGKGKGHDYGVPDAETGQTYYGRGDVQLTWKRNYAKMGALVGVDLVADPDKALDPDISAHILIAGMILGSFTTKKLADFDRGSDFDWLTARRIINGADQAATIKGYALAFDAALLAAGMPLVASGPALAQAAAQAGSPAVADITGPAAANAAPEPTVSIPVPIVQTGVTPVAAPQHSFVIADLIAKVTSVVAQTVASVVPGANPIGAIISGTIAAVTHPDVQAAATAADDAVKSMPEGKPALSSVTIWGALGVIASSLIAGWNLWAGGDRNVGDYWPLGTAIVGAGTAIYGRLTAKKAIGSTT